MVAVLGAGSWGTALAVHLARRGRGVTLWAHRTEHAKALARDRENARYLPGVTLPDSIEVVSDLTTLANRDIRDYVVVVPSKSYRNTLVSLSDALVAAGVRPATVTSATKGFDPESLSLLGDITESVFEDSTSGVVLSGPSFAADLAQSLPIAVALAGRDGHAVDRVHALFHAENFRVYRNADYRGVQIAGAVKNVLAIATGIADGLSLGASARAALITRGLAELVRLGVALGAKAETFYGLAGMGDLVLTCTDDKSRNRRVGLGVGRGIALTEVLVDIGQHVEGVDTVRAVMSLANRHGVSVPICSEVHRVLYEGVAAEAALATLLRREVGDESKSTVD